jgi:hypothetical protein
MFELCSIQRTLSTRTNASAHRQRKWGRTRRTPFHDQVFVFGGSGIGTPSSLLDAEVAQIGPNDTLGSFTPISIAVSPFVTYLGGAALVVHDELLVGPNVVGVRLGP